MDNKNFIIIGLVIIICVGVLAAFFASSNPDGLDSTFEGLAEQGDVPTEQVDSLAASVGYTAPVPDYSVTALGEGGASSAVAIVAGIFIVFVLIYGIGYLIKKD